jgi:hypothetical protein
MLYPDIKVIVFLGAAALLLAPQDEPKPKDPPKITFQEKGDFVFLVKDLEDKFGGGRIGIRAKIPSKDVAISVRDAGFYEALDALCRAHKEATYCPDSDDGPGGRGSPLRRPMGRIQVVLPRALQNRPGCDEALRPGDAQGERAYAQVEMALFDRRGSPSLGVWGRTEVVLEKPSPPTTGTSGCPRTGPTCQM